MLAQLIKGAVVAGGVAVSFGLPLITRSPRLPSPETVEVTPRAFVYRLAGDFQLSGRPVDAPAVTIARRSSLQIMKRRVTAAEYDRCAATGACKPTSPQGRVAPGVPAVKVSWDDATAYASWLSKQTGYAWRLPTDEEWAFAAGSRFYDDALSTAATADSSARWLARYEKEAKLASQDQRPRPAGMFGENEFGLLDLSGNVWEWTNTCFTRRSLDSKSCQRFDIAITASVYKRIASSVRIEGRCNLPCLLPHQHQRLWPSVGDEIAFRALLYPDQVFLPGVDARDRVQ
jgi:formylglycine-generating enzyme required for sulfatase activity